VGENDEGYREKEESNGGLVGILGGPCRVKHKCPHPPRGHPPAGQDLPRPESALDHDQDDPSRGRDEQIGRPKNDRCRLSKADAWASLPDWQEKPGCTAGGGARRAGVWGESPPQKQGGPPN